MTSLHEIQRNFYAALVDEVTRDGARGLEVYRNNLRAAAAKTLADDYPAIERLVGAACWRGLARDYLRAHPSRSGDLRDFGAVFPGFLDARFGATPFAYLGEVARLERAIAECFHRARHAAVTVSVLQEFAPQEYPDIRFVFQPGCHFVQSIYPVVTIWRANREPLVTDEINLGAGPEQAIVAAADGEPALYSLPARDFAFASALARGATLEAAHAEVATGVNEFDAGRVLHALFARQLICGTQCRPVFP